MASRIIGIDLGAYSVKVVVSNPGFRHALVSGAWEARVPDGDEPHLVRAVSVVGDLLRQIRKDDDAVFSSIAGDQVFLHVLEFEFRSMRRVDLERVVGSELEGILPIDLEDMVFAFEQIPRLHDETEGGAPEDSLNLDGAPQQHGRIAHQATGMRVLAAATQREKAEQLLTALHEVGASPRGLLAAPAPYARLSEKIGEGSSKAVAILDMGHMRTDFCLSKAGKPIFARTFARGGNLLTRALGRAWKMDAAAAEEAKHQSGCIASSMQPVTGESAQAMSAVLEKELSSQAREIRRTIQSCRAKTGFVVEELILVGGGSRLRGVAAYFSEKLRLRVRHLDSAVSAGLLGEAASQASLDTCFLALGVSMDGASAKPSFDLRQGALAFKGDMSFLRTKVRTLAAFAVIVMAFGVVAAYAGMRKLRKAEETLNKRVALESLAAFGEQLDAEGVKYAVGPVRKHGKKGPLPKMTAYDVLIAFNAALPKKDETVIDVKDIDITPGKIVVKATSSPVGEIDALQGIKNLEKSLKESECFKDFKSPKSNPSSKDKDNREFTLTIKSECNKE